VSFIKANFQYELENADDIKLEGDIDSIWLNLNQM
jgi:hypothetical protein